MKKNLFLILLLVSISFSVFSFPPVDGDENLKGFERTTRIDGMWNWGTNGHGSFDNAIMTFNADKDVSVYNTRRTHFRVFTRGNKNYVEMVCDWGGGVYTYTTTNTNPDYDKENNSSAGSKSADAKSETERTRMDEGKWHWGTFSLGSFDVTSQILKKEGDVVSFKTVGKTKYRIFTHGTLNFIEVDYGWSGGVFTYTTNTNH